MDQYLLSTMKPWVEIPLPSKAGGSYGKESIHPESVAAKRTLLPLPKVSHKKKKNLSFQNGCSLSNEAGLLRFCAHWCFFLSVKMSDFPPQALPSAAAAAPAWYAALPLATAPIIYLTDQTRITETISSLLMTFLSVLTFGATCLCICSAIWYAHYRIINQSNKQSSCSVI